MTALANNIFSIPFLAYNHYYLSHFSFFPLPCCVLSAPLLLLFCIVMLVILFPVCDLRVWHESKILILTSRVVMQAWSKVLTTSTLFGVANRQYVLQTRPSSRTAVILSRPLSQTGFGNPARRPYRGRINRIPVVKYGSLHTSCHVSFPNSAMESTPGHDLPSGSFVDHTRPDLFYHLLEPPTPLSPDVPVYALSFLPSAPPVPNSATIIGWLPASTESQTEQDAGLNDFKENSACLSFFLSRCTESAGLL